MIHLTVTLECHTESQTGELFDGDFRPAKRPKGLVEVAPAFDMPSGIPICVYGVYDPDFQTGELLVESAGTELAHVTPLRVPLHLRVRLVSEEVLCLSVTTCSVS